MKATLNHISHTMFFSDDPTATGEFFSALFGWSISPASHPNGCFWGYQAGEINGAITKSKSPLSGTTILEFVNVSSIPESIAKAIQLGASVFHDETRASDGVTVFAILTIPGNVQIGISSQSIE